MLSVSQLQFRLMTPEAQRAATHRLALHGWDAKTISTHTGMTEADVQRHLSDTGVSRPRPTMRRRGISNRLPPDAPHVASHVRFLASTDLHQSPPEQ